jgi:hypothetical protein
MSEKDIQKEELEKLDRAVAAFDSRAAVEALYASKVLDGIDESLRKKFRALRNDEDFHHAIAQGVDVLVGNLEEQKAVSNAVGLVWRVAERAANVEVRRRRRENPTDPQLMAGTVLPVLPADPIPAIHEARRLLPRIHGENARNVLTLILDAMEQGRQVLTSSDIAEQLNITEDNARQLRKRAFDRLLLLAREEQAAGRGFNLSELEDDEELLVSPDSGDDDMD